jgi:hypothetical protein
MALHTEFPESPYAPLIPSQRWFPGGRDLHTFKDCRRVVRGFALSDEEALTATAEWNLRCRPLWSEHKLRDTINRARQYGREQIGGVCAAAGG